MRAKVTDVMEILRGNSALKHGEVNSILLTKGFETTHSSMVSHARKKLGVMKIPGKRIGLKAIQIEDLERAKLIPVLLGYSTKETIEIATAIHEYSMSLGGTPRLIEALETLQKLQG